MLRRGRRRSIMEARNDEEVGWVSQDVGESDPGVVT